MSDNRKSLTQGGPGFGYGFIVAWAFVMSFFTLLCGLIVEGFKDTINSASVQGAFGSRGVWQAGKVACGLAGDEQCSSQ